MTTIPTVENFNLFDSAVNADPYPYYAWLREHDPVHFSSNLGAWVISRHADVTDVLRRHAEFSSAPRGGEAVGNRFLLGSDPPDHTKLRRLVARPFQPSAIATLEGAIARTCDALVDEFLTEAATSPLGIGDVVERIAYPLPVIVIADLLGIPAERREDFKRWSSAMLGGLDLVPRVAAAATYEMRAFFTEVIQERRRRPGDDLISTLVSRGEELTEQELWMFCMLLLIAGNETTTNLISNLLLALVEWPGAQDELRRCHTLTANVVEEALRYDAPVQAVWRLTTADTAVGGTPLRAGERVLVLQGSANRDPQRFADPDRFDVTRGTLADHVTFGVGIHYCLGAPLARLETRVVIDSLLARTQRLALPPVSDAHSSRALERVFPEPESRDRRAPRSSGRPKVRRHPVVRGLRHLRLSVDCP